MLLGLCQERCCSHRGDGFAERFFVGPENAQVERTEIAHGASCRANIEGIAGANQHDAQIFEIGSLDQRQGYCKRSAAGNLAWRSGVPTSDSGRLSKHRQQTLEELMKVSRCVWVGFGSLAFLLAAAGETRAQMRVAALAEIKNQAELDQAVTALDRALFDAYNRCDLSKFASLVADDVEFYHDSGGVTLGKEKLVESVKNNICTQDVRRELVPGTLKIYHMKGYGAIEMGVHRFVHQDGHTNRRGEFCALVAVQRRRV